jgi:hypothetical protein
VHAGRASTNRRSQPPGPTLLSTLITIFCGGTHSTRRYWMLMRPVDMGDSLLYVSAWMSMWSGSHSGQLSVICTITDTCARAAAKASARWARGVAAARGPCRTGVRQGLASRAAWGQPESRPPLRETCAWPAARVTRLLAAGDAPALEGRAVDALDLEALPARAHGRGVGPTAHARPRCNAQRRCCMSAVR